jgi:hypothetical protein
MTTTPLLLDDALEVDAYDDKSEKGSLVKDPADDDILGLMVVGCSSSTSTKELYIGFSMEIDGNSFGLT